MAKVLDYDFERSIWSKVLPIVGGTGSGVGGYYLSEGNPIIALISGGAGAVAGYGGAIAYEDGKVFDKSGYGNTGYLRNGAHVEDGVLVLDGDDDYVLVPDDPSLDVGKITVSLDFTRRTVADEGITTLIGKFQDGNNYWVVWLRRADHENAEISFTTEVDGERSSVGTGRRITPGRYAVDCEFDGSELAMYLSGEEVDRSPGKLATYEADVYIGSQRGGRFAHCNFRRVSIHDRAVHA